MMTYKTSVSNAELECRYVQPISRAQFIKAVTYYRSTLPASAFEEHEETMDVITRSARLRIQGRQVIQKYCATNLLTESDVSEVIQKTPVKGYAPVFLDSVNFKVDLKQENQIKDLSDILAQLPSTPKMFRFKKRMSVNDVNGGVRYDMTITKSSVSNTHMNFISSGTLNSSEKYEFEIEFTSTQTDPYMLLKPMIEAYMLISNTKVVVPNRTKLIQDYLILTEQATQQLKPFMVANKPKKYLVGPKPVSIELKNVCVPPLMGTPNIRNDYTVTEKTDGERHLMYIDPLGAVYLFNNRFDIMPLNVKLNKYKNSIFDGEWVVDQSMFAIFDAYYVNGNDTRGRPLVPDRLNQMKEFHAHSHTTFKTAGVTLHMKEFLHASKDDDIFVLSKKILEKKLRKEFPFHIDGLIFTPASLPVGGLFKEDAPSGFGTWKAVFKWKPTEENTIDFLVKYERDEKGQPKVLIKDGIKHIVCTLYCGYKPTQWEKINILDFLETGASFQGNTNYMARRFLPPDYVGNDISYYYASSPSEVEDDSIVEFSYDLVKKQWVFLRTRHDKTDLYRKNGITDTANDWGTAMNIWHTINYPVTDKMICGVQNVSKENVPDENVYYSRNTTRDKFASRSMMDFHNEGIKNISLIKPQKERCKRLLDLACGKGGDINKWASANIKEVVGFDYVEDNIVNPVDGAYARLQQKQKHGDIPKDYKYIFMSMDCSKPLGPQQATQESDKRLAEVLWGTAKGSLSPELEKLRGMMSQPFDVVSCQFAIHYFFAQESTLDTFLANVDKHLAMGGRFIGTCLDGKRVKKALQGIPKDSSLTGWKSDRIMWDIKKRYDDSSKIQFGDAIDIYMESIGRIATEFLVDTSLLKSKMEKLGYKTIFIKGFDDAFNEVLPQLQGHYKDSIKGMSDEEKKYSFMNCMFCFEKGEVVKKRIGLKKPQETSKEDTNPEIKIMPVPDANQEPPKVMKRKITLKKT